MSLAPNDGFKIVAPGASESVSVTTILPLKELRQVSMDWACLLVGHATTLTESKAILGKVFLCMGESLLFS